MGEERITRREGRQVWVEDAILDRVQVIADKERRTLRAQVEALLEEALFARQCAAVSER